MPHITEGLLHAHVDGALAPDDPEWIAAEVHLEHCDACRRRLAEVRQLRAAVGEILAGADAPVAERPAFDDLAERARSRREENRGEAIRRRPPWWRSPAKLAWAASLVLAVGAGWMGRALLVSPDSSPSVREVRQAENLASDGLNDAVAEEARSPAVADDRVRRDAAEAEEAPAEARGADADPVAQERDVPDRARMQAPPAAAEQQGFAAKAGVTVRCYTGGKAGDAAELRLSPDGSARLRLDDVLYVGFWESGAPGELNLRLSDGGAWLDLDLRETDGGVRGILAPSSLARTLSLAPAACGGD